MKDGRKVNRIINKNRSCYTLLSVSSLTPPFIYLSACLSVFIDLYLSSPTFTPFSHLLPLPFPVSLRLLSPSFTRPITHFSRSLPFSLSFSRPFSLLHQTHTRQGFPDKGKGRGEKRVQKKNPPTRLSLFVCTPICGNYQARKL